MFPSLSSETDGSADERSLRERSRSPYAVRAVGRALQGGLFATVVMTAFRLPILRSLPPTANFWSKYVGRGHPEEYTGIGLVLHLVYGAVGGAIFGLLYATLDLFPGAATETRGVIWGGAYGMALSVFGDRVVLQRALGMPVEEGTETVFHTSHLIYGVALGGWVGSRMDLTESYEEYEHTG